LSRLWGVVVAMTAIPTGFALVSAVAAPVATCPPVAGPAVDVAAVPAPFELRLADGTHVRIAGVGLAAAGEGEDASAAALRTLVAAGPVRLDAAPARFDRYGRRLARVAGADGGDLGERLVAAGAALVGPAPLGDGEGPCRERLLAAEAAARAAAAGLWADGTFAVEAADDPLLEARAGRYALVEGRIASLGKAGRTRYLNFGRRWRLDFTATIAESEGAWPRGWGIGPTALEGSRVRVRGWLEADDGGLVRLGRPEDLERHGGPAQR
jgi:hypothetical protein